MELIGGFIVAQIAQRIFVPLLVQLLGPKRFASPSAFDGCTLGIAGALIGELLSFLVHAPKGREPLMSSWTALGVIAIGITLYGLIWLWVLGSEGRGQQWKIEGEQILSREGAPLTPLYAQSWSDYNQTDAFNGYSIYYLELYDGKSHLLGINSYTVEEKRTRELEALRALFPKLRTFSLNFAQRHEPRIWRVVYLREVWGRLLSGPLERLGEADRNWWHAWCEPHFDGQETVIDAKDWQEHLQRLYDAYPDYPPLPQESDNWRIKGDFKRFRKEREELELLFTPPEIPIVALSPETYEQSAKAACGKERWVQFHDLDGFVYLGNAYEEKEKRRQEEKQRERLLEKEAKRQNRKM